VKVVGDRERRADADQKDRDPSQQRSGRGGAAGGNAGGLGRGRRGDVAQAGEDELLRAVGLERVFQLRLGLRQLLCQRRVGRGGIAGRVAPGVQPVNRVAGLVGIWPVRVQCVCSVATARD
jgi:hypothetical protein